VGMQGVAVAERAYQHAVAYARDRLQSRPVDGSSRDAVAIIHHPDVKRMLMTMRALTEGARALAYVAAAQADIGHNAADAGERKRAQAVYEFLVPIVKGWSTEMSLDVTSLGVQVHGGMGFIEETGAAQYYRDARILPIYESTTAIQANDLIGRKTLRDGGAVARALFEQVAATENELRAAGGVATSVAERLAKGREALSIVVDYVIANTQDNANAVFAGSVPYLKLAGIVLGGWQMGRALLAAQARRAEDPAFYDAKIGTARFFADHILTQAPGLAQSITEGADSALSLSEAQF